MTTLQAMELPRLDRSRLAASQVFEYLRDQIISLELSPGTTLSRTALAKTFQLSSTPIRDALMKLEEEKLVEIFPQHATMVSPIDLGLVRQAHFLRRSIELEIVRTLAATPDPLLLKRLEASVERQEAMLGVGNLEEFVSGDQVFHREMYEAAGLPDLWLLVRRQSGHLDRLRRLHLPAPGKAADILRDHRAILAAIAGGDPDAAQATLRRHLSSTLANVADIRSRFPSYFRG